MEKTVIGLLAAIGAATPLAAAQASVVSSEDAASALRVASVADLLEPVPNAPAILAALDAEPQNAPAAAQVPEGVQVAQWHHHHWHHHHWHHHHWGPRFYYHHHHHHRWHHHHWHHHHHWGW